MAEQQLIDYIQKARQAGQVDDQSKSLLYKNGWTEQEVNDALLAIGQTQPKPQQQPATQVQAQPKLEQQEVQIQQSEAQTQYQPQEKPKYQYQMADSMPMERKSGHLILKLLIVLIILVALGGVGWFFKDQVMGFVSNISLFGPSSDKVLQNMLANLKDVKSSHSLTQINVEVKDDSDAAVGSLSLETEGDGDVTDPQNPIGNYNVTINLDLSSAPTPSQISAKISMIGIGTTSYAKIENLQIPTEYLNGFDVSNILGVWFKIDQNSLNAISQVESGSVNPVNLSQTNNQELTQKVRDLLLSENMLAVDKELSDETINGQATYHYLVKITKDKLKDFLTKFIDLSMQEAAKAQGSTEPDSNTLISGMMSGFVSPIIDAFGDLDMDMWIGKKDFMLYQVKIDKSVDLSGLVPNINNKLAIKLTTNSSDFNKAVLVQAPENPQNLEDIVIPLLKVQKIQADMAGLNNNAQTVFNLNKSYSTVCIKGLLNGYQKEVGAELVATNTDIISQGGKKPECFSSVNSYCISTQMLDGSFTCVSSNGVLGKTKCTSAITVCE